MKSITICGTERGRTSPRDQKSIDLTAFYRTFYCFIASRTTSTLTIVTNRASKMMLNRLVAYPKKTMPLENELKYAMPNCKEEESATLETITRIAAHRTFISRTWLHLGHVSFSPSNGGHLCFILCRTWQADMSFQSETKTSRCGPETAGKSNRRAVRQLKSFSLSAYRKK